MDISYLLFYLYLFDIEYMQKYLNLEKIISSFTLYEGFGYVWIIRVFLLVAILTPVYLFVINKFGEYVSFFIFLLSVIFLSFLGEKNLINYKSFTITDIIIPAISYGLMFITGYCCVRSTNKKMLFFILVISAFLFSLTCYYNGFHPQSWKYPPLSQYIFYAITISIILYKTVDFIYNKINSNSAILTFIASNTMWIYLWHIPIVEHVIKTRMFNDYLIRWAFVSIVTISVVAVQYLMVKLILKYVNNKKISSVIKKVFTG
ncbi:TPA: acyltransferase family protein [Proteus mirabilis]